MKSVDDKAQARPAVEVDEGTDEVLITLRGELDLSNIAELESAVVPLLERPSAGRFVFELSELGFIDSTGIAVLLRTAARGKSILLRHPSSVLREVIVATGLTEILEVEP